MQFAPVPQNDFANYIETYFRECRARFPAIEAIAGKWMFRDLLPGMSDFDTRFILRDGMDCADWCEMSRIIGETHLRLSQRHPSWARNLEHLPGINLTWSELGDPGCYYPEYRQWTFYHTTEPERLTAALEKLDERGWGSDDEYFFLKKFCLYFGRYDRQIDPPVNLGVHESKYPLHSRIMHYFEPPLQAAMMLIRRQITAGKFEALEWGSKYFAAVPGWDYIWEIMTADYIGEHFYSEANLVRLEDILENILIAARDAIRTHVTLIPAEAGSDVALWKKALNAVPVAPALRIFDSSKFCRLMKGRLYFYGNSPEFFDPTWPIQNEFARLNSGYLVVPFSTFGKLYYDRDFTDCRAVFAELKASGLISAGELAALERFDLLTRTVPKAAEAKAKSLELAEFFDEVFSVLYNISNLAREMK